MLVIAPSVYPCVCSTVTTIAPNHSLIQTNQESGPQLTKSVCLTDLTCTVYIQKNINGGMWLKLHGSLNPEA